MQDKCSHIVRVILNILKFDRMQKARVKAYENSYNRHRDAKLKVKIEKKMIIVNIRTLPNYPKDSIEYKKILDFFDSVQIEHV